MTMTSRTVLITGASSGIGRQLALDYAADDWHVIACGRNQTRLEALSNEATGTMTCCVFDVTDKSTVGAAFSSLSTMPDVWIFNAGDCEYINEGVIDSDVFEQIMRVNFQGVVHCLDAAQSYLKAGSQVAVTSSIASVFPFTRAEAYGASKAAIDYLVKTLQIDWRQRDITLSLIHPGFVATPLTDRNTFAMPMMISPQKASATIRAGIAAKKERIYTPWLFTWILRCLSHLPHRFQQRLGAALSARSSSDSQQPSSKETSVSSQSVSRTSNNQAKQEGCDP